jgi:hypothetical protein
MAASTTLLICISVGAFSYGYAKQAAAEIEARIDSAKTVVRADTTVLREDLVAAAKLDTLTDGQALRLAELAQQHPGPRGTRIVALELSKHFPHAVVVDDSLRAALETTFKKYRKASSRHRQNLTALQGQYNDQLRSPWVGRWMHLAGYPKSNAKHTKELRPAPASRMQSAPPAEAPIAYTPNRTE